MPGVVFGRMRYGRIGRTLRAHPVLVDTALALTVCLFALVPLTLSSGPSARMVLLTCAAAAPLCLRRRYPVSALIVCAAASYAQILLWVPSFGTFSSMLIAFYTVAKWSQRRAMAGAALIITVWIVWFSLRLPHVRDVDRIGVMLLFLPAAIAAGVLGVNANTRRAYVASIADRAERAERERDQQALLAAAGERARIAREMHDIVAHNLSVMIALADGASYTLRDLVASHAAGSDPTASGSDSPTSASGGPAMPGPRASELAGGDRTDAGPTAGTGTGTSMADPARVDRASNDDRALRAARAVESVSSTGREALAQMRSLLGVLRDNSGLAKLPPVHTSAPGHGVAPVGAARPAAVYEPFDVGDVGDVGNGWAGGDAAVSGRLPDESATAPQPRIADLDRLVNQVRHAGRTVGFLIAGERHDLPADAELTVFRIVQEALTNVLKHAAPRSRALVRLSFDPGGVDIEITDSVPDLAAGTADPARDRRSPGPSDVPEPANPYGRGIQGMRERAALHDGHLVAGPIAGKGDGWRVAARINAPAAHQPASAAPWAASNESTLGAARVASEPSAP
ncbi:histidine kinase [Pseudofrankia sp. BMG5.37]|uniref:sensor histidine kinase n=1 Tax=Pseudofrankia sp. BMG5.37 TaxID=3050035 RepID=UPI0028A1AC6A|nr:histidine kinase [Pseudofrankia sp. BMG5.37]